VFLSKRINSFHLRLHEIAYADPGLLWWA